MGVFAHSSRPLGQPGDLSRGSILRLGVFVFFSLLAAGAYVLLLGLDRFFFALFLLLMLSSLIVCHLYEKALPYFPIWALMAFAFIPLTLRDRLAIRIPMVYLAFVFPFTFLALAHFVSRRPRMLAWSLPLRIVSFLLMVAVTFSVMRADDKQEAILYAAAWLAYGVIVMRGMAHVAARCDAEKLLPRIVGAVAALSVLGVAKYAVVRDKFYASNPISSLDNNALIFLTAPVGTLAFALVLLKPTRWRILAFLLIATQIVFSRSRTGLIGLTLGILIVTALLRGRHWKSAVVAWLAVALIAGGSVVAGTTGFINLNKVFLIVDVIGLWTGGEVALEDLHRRTVLQGAVQVIQDNYVLGTGFGRDNYINALRQTSIDVGSKQYVVAHNLYLTYLGQLGIIGFLVLLGFFGVIGLDVIRSRSRLRNATDRTLLAALLAGHGAIVVMFAGNEFITAPFPWWFWGLALGIAGSRLRRGAPAVVRGVRQAELGAHDRRLPPAGVGVRSAQ